MSLSDYVKRRNYVIGEVINLAQTVFSNDRKQVSSVIDLTVKLEISEPVPDFVNNLQGFLLWASSGNQEPSMVLETFLHDLTEFDKVLHDSSFSPRTSGYIKYLSGASGVMAV